MKSSFAPLVKYVKDYKGLLLANILCSAGVAIFTVVSIPVLGQFLQLLFDKTVLPTETVPFEYSISGFNEWLNYRFGQVIINQGKQRASFYVCIILVSVFLFKNIFRYLALYFRVPIRNGVIRDIRNALYNKIMRLPLTYFSEQKKGDLIARFSSDTLEIENSILSTLEVIIKSPLIIVGCITFMLYISPQLTLFVFVLILFTIVIIGGISRALKRSSRKAQSRMGDLVSLVDESIGGIKVIKAFTAENRMETHFQNSNESYKSLLNRIIWRRDLSSPLTEFLAITVVAVLIWYGSSMVFSDQLSGATFIAFIYAFFNVIEPAKGFSKAYYNIQKGLAAVERVEAVIEESEEDWQGDAKGLAFEDQIALSSVHFSYVPETSVLNGLSMQIPKGKTVALVGSSGAGKTTLIDLLNRFYEIQSGAITIDGRDIRSLPLADVRSLFALVSQDPVVFHDSVYNNISFGRENATTEQVEQAAKIAHAHDFIQTLPDGYQTIIGDRGMRLSGGQRQRLTLARAILQDCPILILDEATSSLDSESEQFVQQAIEEVAKTKTLIVIAHRLSTIRHADIIYVMREGKVVESGSHNSLMETSEEYKKFVELQAF